MPSAGRKFLLAGKGGLNLTHSEPFEAFVSRYGAAAQHVEPWLEAFDALSLREWAQGLGTHTFVGTSGRVFPAGHEGRAAAARVAASLARRTACGSTCAIASPAGMRTARCVSTAPRARKRCAPVPSCSRWAGQLAAARLRRRLGAAAAAARRRSGCRCCRPIAASMCAAAGASIFASAVRRPAVQVGRRHAVPTVPRRTGRIRGHRDRRRRQPHLCGRRRCLRDEIRCDRRATSNSIWRRDRDPEQVRSEVAHPRGSSSMANHLRRRLAPGRNRSSRCCMNCCPGRGPARSAAACRGDQGAAAAADRAASARRSHQHRRRRRLRSAR